MANCNLLRCGLDTKEALSRLIARQSHDILKPVAVVNVGSRRISGSGLLSNESDDAKNQQKETDHPDNDKGEVYLAG
jgi:hypothetical protein